MMDVVTSARNPKVVAAARLAQAKERRTRGEMLLEGPHLVDEAARAGIHLVSLFGLATDDLARRLAQDARAAWIPCTSEVLTRLGSTDHPRGPIAVAAIPAVEVPWRRDSVVAHVSDPGNAGTLIRSAAAFGLDIRFGGRAVDVWSPKVLRAGAGAHFLTGVSTGLEVVPLSVGTIATVVEGGEPVPDAIQALDPTRLWAIVVGSEAHGLDRSAIARSTVAVTIPMAGATESLNAAVAGSIVAYELARWRYSVGGPTGGH
jgi:TrmH family RNA methyltransferase